MARGNPPNRRELLAALGATFACAAGPIGAQVRTGGSTAAASGVGAELDRALKDVVIANRILANQGVADAYGHVSLRHPTVAGQFLLARSRSPELVETGDVMAFRPDGSPVDAAGPQPYLERFIHAAILSARPEVNAVVHAHAPEVLPYTVTSAPLRPVIQNAGVMGAHVPVWDIADRFGDTNLLVVNMAEGVDLARRLGRDNVVLMRGHGFAAAGRNLIEVLRMSIYLKLNAAVLSEASRLGPVKALSAGEIARIRDVSPDAPELRRAWEYWARRAGVADLL